MAASDPTTGVPTPTGTLQGLATFSWDGATWQPSGRAMPSVATPTGVLRGVAPFSWDGATWQPTGQAMPSVATPSGVLDGVALYTWSGSAWTPTGGAPDVPTPSGVLQGIAAFNWDGTTWQPAGQAAAEVPTPYGVLAGAAMFSWGGSTWAPTVAGTALDINFLNTTTLDARVTLARSSVATYFDVNGVMQTAAANVPRFDNDPNTLASRGLLIEEARTNLSLGNFVTYWTLGDVTLAAAQPGAPDGTATMTRVAEDAASAIHFLDNLEVVTASTTYAASVYAKAQQNRWLQLFLDNGSGVGGYATFDLQAGTISGPLTALGAGVIGTAAIQNCGNGLYRCSIATTIGANTGARFGIALSNVATPGWAPSYPGNTANGLLIWGPQLEQGAFATSYIPTPGAAQVSRAVDSATIASIPGRNASAESFAAEFMVEGITAHNACVIGSSASGLLAMYLDTSAPFGIGAWDGTNATATTTNKIATMTVAKGASNWTASVGNACLNAGAVLTYNPMSAGFAALTPIKLMGDNAITDTVNGWIRRFRYWPRVLSNTEMQAVTT